MSYYQKRTVLAKINDSETSNRWHSLLRQLKENNEDMPSVEEIISKSETNNGALEFEFEYYSSEAFEEFENLLKDAESPDNQDGVIVKLDSDYGSYISTFGKVETEKISPNEENWSTGAFASVMLCVNSEKLANWIGCEADDTEDTLEDGEKNLAELFGVSEYEGIELELESYEEDDGESIIQLGLGFDFLRYGTIDELAYSYNAIKNMEAVIASMAGTLTLGQPDILLLKDSGECDWISEQGFKELKLESTANNLGEFVATQFVLV